MMLFHVDYRVNPPVTNEDLDRLYAAAWPNHRSPFDFGPELERLLAFVGAYVDGELIGFVKLAWDGAVHAFLLEPTVHPTLRHRGIGRALVEQAVAVARERGLEWLHVDYAPHLDAFYRACGFQPTAAGLIRLDRATGDAARPPAVPRRAIVVFPNPADLRPILPFRGRWDPLAALVPPHLTLVFPFSDPITPEDLRTHVAHAIRDVAPFAVRLSGVTASEGEYLFLNVKQGNDALIALHDRLYTGPLEPHRSRRHTFVPHLTVGRVADRHDFETALAEAAASPVALETLVRAVSIHAIDADGTRRTAADLPLRHAETGG